MWSQEIIFWNPVKQILTVYSCFDFSFQIKQIIEYVHNDTKELWHELLANELKNDIWSENLHDDWLLWSGYFIIEMRV